MRTHPHMHISLASMHARPHAHGTDESLSHVSCVVSLRYAIFSSVLVT